MWPYREVVLTFQKSWRNRQVPLAGDWESSSDKPVRFRIPTTFQIADGVVRDRGSAKKAHPVGSWQRLSPPGLGFYGYVAMHEVGYHDSCASRGGSARGAGGECGEGGRAGSPPPLPEVIAEEMIEDYEGEDAHVAAEGVGRAAVVNASVGSRGADEAAA
ncbi:hypothetical protein L3X38_033264 [Prunus dulcis]|uniref:Uncharacterized protein n=1 Tax=Prunus dulcis TaxID=3755 RepID=A0AAD4VGP7_PRUDU|nr:hypothetical protein L3X38_033264 [Prunus dulcis]